MSALLRRVLAEKRALVVPLAGALALNALAYVIVVRPLKLKSEGASDRAVAASNNLRASEEDLARARALVSGKAQADEELSAFYQKVLPVDLTAARRMTYASLPALARKNNVRYEARTTSVADRDRDTHLGRMTIRMVLQGEYRDIRQFIYQLESAPDFVIIDNLTLAEGTANEPQTLTINLSTYYRLGPSGR
jgi:Tfp pilus assembly protein PilO